MTAWGVQPRYVDSTGTTRRSRRRTVARIEAALGPPPDDPTSAPGPLIVGPGGELPPGTLRTEDGRELAISGSQPEPLPLGYHQLATVDGTERSVIVSPGRCVGGTRRWGWATQLYGVRSAASWGMGDLGDLARLARWAGSLGAGYILLNPLGAAAPVAVQEPSPYYRATRRFTSPLYLCVDEVPGAGRAGDAVERARRAGRALNDIEVIDRDAVWHHKRAALSAIWRAGPPPDDFERWLRCQPPSLHRFATWSALTERHGPRFPAWPAKLRHPDGPAVAAFARTDEDAIRFHAWLQWVAGLQLRAAAGTVDLIQDLAIGFDPQGFDAWDWQDLLALDMSIGAPPDAFNPAGQDWGLPPFVPGPLRASGYRPFVDTLRATMAGAGGLRIDHILGLFRLWWIPAGNGPADGCYVRFPADDLLAVLALESHRHGVPVIGEDLGTVGRGVRRALAAHDVLSSRVLWFDRHPPARWPEPTAASITTHDLPTTAGVWTGADVDHQRAAGQPGDPAAIEAMRDRLVAAADLAGDEPVAAAVTAVHRALAAAPSRLRTATLEDAVAETARPNLPGTIVATNWRRPLPVTLEELEVHPLAGRVAAALDGR